MADINLTYPTGTSANQIQTKDLVPQVRSRLIDIAEFNTKKGSNVAAADVLLALPIFAGERVLNVGVRIVTAGTASSTVTVGDGDDTDGWIKSVTCDSAANTQFNSNGAYIFTQATSTDKPVTWVGGKLYTADDSIDLVAGGTPPVAGQMMLEMTYVHTY